MKNNIKNKTNFKSIFFYYYISLNFGITNARPIWSVCVRARIFIALKLKFLFFYNFNKEMFIIKFVLFLCQARLMIRFDFLYASLLTSFQFEIFFCHQKNKNKI